MKTSFWSRICVLLLYCLLVCSSFLIVGSQNVSEKEEEAKAFLRWYETESSKLCTQSSLASWDFQTNITDDNQRKSLEADLLNGKFAKDAWINVTSYDWKNFVDESLKRQFKLLSVIGTPALSEEKLLQFNNVTATMSGIYGSTKICSYNDSSVCNLSLEPEATKILAESRNYDELLFIWKQWHDNVGHKCKSLYKTYVELGNEAAKLNGLNDLGDIWREPFEDENYEEDIAKLWEELKPAYLQLHAYMRKKLVQFYSDKNISRIGPIPAHLLGNMWAQSWGNLMDIAIPYPEVTNDVNDEILRQNYTVDHMFHLADDFFTSLGLIKMPETFWNNSMLVKPDDREVICHASAWDFCDGRDFRIKMCTVVTLDNFIVIHHEMGHIQYYLQYKDQPITFRDGANPGFHEAVGDVMALSASSSKHLRTLNLTGEVNSQEADLNFLMGMALEKLAFLPFGFVVDTWRWKLFRGEIPEENWNTEWWNMRKDYQGISPALPRTSDDFDPAAKYHVVADTPYDRYFVSFVIQFQFHKALCEIAGQYDPSDPNKPLHRCDIYNNKSAGRRLSEALSLGSSKPWPDVMELLTGQRKMNASAFLEFFSPLISFLEEDNRRTGEKIGWD